MKIKRYELKKNIKIVDLLKAGALVDDKGLYFYNYITIKNTDLRITIAFTDFTKDKVKAWNDIDYTSILNTDDGVEYKVWKSFQRTNQDIPKGGLLEELVTEYNNYMDKLPIFKAVKTEK